MCIANGNGVGIYRFYQERDFPDFCFDNIRAHGNETTCLSFVKKI